MEIRLQERKALVQDYCKRHNRNADTVLDKDLLISTYFAAGNSFTVLYPKSQAQIEKKRIVSLGTRGQANSRQIEKQPKQVPSTRSGTEA